MKKACFVRKALPAENGRFIIQMDTDRAPENCDSQRFNGMHFDNYYLALSVARTANEWINRMYPQGFVGVEPCVVRRDLANGELLLVSRNSSADGKKSWLEGFTFSEGHATIYDGYLTQYTRAVTDKESQDFISRVQRHYSTLPGRKLRLVPVSIRKLSRP